MHRIFALTAGIALFFLGVVPDRLDAGWRYSPYYQAGYAYYYGGAYGTQTYYPAGYYYYEPPVVVTEYRYVDRYVPVVFSTYQPQGVQTYQTASLMQVTGLQRTPQAVGLPQQAAGTDGSAYAAICKAHAEAMEARFEARFTKLESTIARAVAPRLDKADAAAVPAPQQAKAPLGGLAVLQNRCASCHGKDTAETKGNALVYFGDQKELLLTDKMLTGFYRQIISGKMPKDAPMTEAEVRAALIHLDTYQPRVIADAK